MNNKDIQNLVEKFLNAETTLEEEQELYDIFAQAEIPDELKPYQEMFRDYACMETINTGHTDDKKNKDTSINFASSHNVVDLKPKINKWKYIGIAASVALIFSFGISFFHPTNNNFAVTYVNGEKISDEKVALNIGCNAVSDIFSNEDNAGEELQDIFNPN